VTDIERDLRASTPRGADPAGFAEALARRAADAGLLDVAYATTDSPMGELTVFVTPRGLVRLAYPGEREDELLAELAARVSPRILRAPGPTDEVRRELDDYFAGRRRTFDIPLDWTLVRGFARGVLRATADVPFGAVTTYGQVAAQAGSPRGARADRTARRIYRDLCGDAAGGVRGARPQGAVCKSAEGLDTRVYRHQRPV